MRHTRMGSHSQAMSGKKVKRLGDAQKRKKQSEITTSMTSKFLRRLIIELSTSRLGVKFERMLGRTTLTWKAARS